MNASFPSSTEGNGVTPTIEEVNLRQDNMETGLHDGIGILNTDQNVNSLETVVGQQQHLSRNFTPQNNTSTLRNRKLPTFLLSNIQSLGSCQNTDKTTELEAVLINNYIDVACLTETWLNDITKDQISFNNYTNFHLIRKNVLRSSGGVSVLVKSDIPANRLNIDVPEHLECIWISLRPKWLPRRISNIVIAGVYYPGSTSKYAPNKEDLILHLMASVHQLNKKYASPLFLLMGDFNDLKVDEICDACDLQQIVNVPTRKNATLDLILTNNTNNFYKEPISLPSIGGSDHLCILYEPISGKISPPRRTIYKRTFKKYAMLQFGAWLTKFDWSTLLELKDVNQKVTYFYTIMWMMIDKFFPLIKITVTDNEKPWITPKIKELISQRQRAHAAKNYDKRNHLPLSTQAKRQELAFDLA